MTSPAAGEPGGGDRRRRRTTPRGCRRGAPHPRRRRPGAASGRCLRPAWVRDRDRRLRGGAWTTCWTTPWTGSRSTWPTRKRGPPDDRDAQRHLHPAVAGDAGGDDERRPRRRRLRRGSDRATAGGAWPRRGSGSRLPA
ncbi:hypothetical protein [Nocardioides convexus]|uniref:hypothetical protein n=1 Tax=Nocardioides convexus TaxID=2712224 RepID=UPI0024188B5B|nr:hypothetical protein [Nocardioides convexus]